MIKSLLKYLKRRKLFLFTLIVLCPMLLVIYSNLAVNLEAADKTFDDVNAIPENEVGLVLGTAKYLKNGNVNLYFKYRIAATVELYNYGKIKYVLISGDNGRSTYDEPTDFKNELVRLGIPSNRIYLDYAGFRTLDSVIRSKEIFGQNRITFISQKFHNERAIYLAEESGIDAVGFNAKDVSGKYGLRVKLREYLARVKAFVDLKLGVSPKFLGPKIKIG